MKILSPNRIMTLLLLMGCATTPAPRPQAYVPRFDFTPPSSSPPGSSGITFALVSPHYSEQNPWTRLYPFDQFATNLNQDYQEALIARGFSLKGPYENYDLMTFPDKEDSDLVLIPLVDVRVDISNSQLASERSLLGIITPGFKISGNAVVRSQLNLVAREPLTMENMWTKNLSVSNTSVPFTTQKRYNVESSAQLSYLTLDVLLEDPGFVQALAPELERAYGDLMRQTWAHLDPAEMQLVAKQAQELKARKRY